MRGLPPPTTTPPIFLERRSHVVKPYHVEVVRTSEVVGTVELWELTMAWPWAKSWVELTKLMA